MTVTREELDNFHHFAMAQLDNGGADLTLDDLLLQWQSLRDRDEVNEIIHQGLQDIEAGCGRDAREVTAELALKHNLATNEL